MSLPIEDDNRVPKPWGLYYAERGWCVIPLHTVRDGRCTCGNPGCKSAGKHPRTPNGLKDATRDARVMATWKARWPGGNIGIVTGAGSGLVVLDIDPRHGGDESLADLERKHGALPETAEVLTGGGGRHIYFRHPGGAVKSGPLPGVAGVDLKADGGYVVAPPSVHLSGRTYQWEVSCHPDDTPLAAAPAWLLALVSREGTSTTKKAADPVEDVIPSGQRNSALASLAGTFRRRGLGAGEIFKALDEVNRRRCIPPLPDDEVRRIAESVCQYPAEAPITGGPAESDPSLPTIVTNNRELRDVSADALSALYAANNPPVLFQRGGILTRVRGTEASDDGDGDGSPRLEFMSESALRGNLARAANWVQEKKSQSGDLYRIVVHPPRDIVQDVASLPDWNFPVIDGLTECPVFDAHGALVTAAGYNPGARVWHNNGLRPALPVVPDSPTQTDVERARSLLLNDLFGDFPFVNEASRAHALAALLLPFCRLLVKGPTPLHLIDAPSPGTGKSLLADAITIPATGRPARVLSEGRDDDEWRKRVTAVLADAPVFVLLDNLRRRLTTGALAAAITATTWTDRILGQTKTCALPVRVVWLATGNNVALSDEMARRSCWIRLDAKVDRPWAREGFKHASLRNWALQHRAELIAAALTLIQAWIAEGRPAGAGVLGNFEQWVEVVGGVLQVAGIPGFLANVEELYDQANEEIQEWEEFVEAWWSRHSDTLVRTEDLFALASEQGLLPSVMDAKTERGQKTKIGMALGRQKDRIIGGYRIETGKNDRSGRRGYSLRRMGDTTEGGTVEDNDDPWT